jgi:GNAT superfamily N-acetyltransferase
MDTEPVVVVSDVDDELAADLDARIYQFNAEATGMADGRFLRIALRGGDGVLIAGLSGWTWGACGYIAVLWVRDDKRRRGLGTRLLDAAEEEMRVRRCTQVATSTHTFQAPEFYAHRGYVTCGLTPNYPRGHAQVHLVKALGHLG